MMKSRPYQRYKVHYKISLRNEYDSNFVNLLMPIKELNLYRMSSKLIGGDTTTAPLPTPRKMCQCRGRTFVPK